MHGEGWRRLWELLKWMAAIATGLFVSFKLIQTAPQVPLAGNNQVGIGIFLGGAIGGLAAYGILQSLEWVYRGFRPLPIAPAEVDQLSPLGVRQASQEPRLALDHQESQQSPSASPTPLREPIRRE